MYKALVAGLSLSILIAACASSPDSGTENADISVPDTRLSPIEEAIDDLLVRIGANAQIEVVLYEDVVWRDGSLGCPQPGMAYTQALEDGYRIELTDGEIVYHYHGVANGAPFLCENPSESGSVVSQDAAPAETLPTVAPGSDGDANVTEQPPTIEPGDNDRNLASLVALASADLAERHSVGIDGIVVVSAESVVWPDGSLGCPIPDMRYTQVQVDGAKIVLSVDGSLYNYHSGGSRDPFLCVPAKGAPGTTGLTLPGNPGLDE
ncbi:MAG: hypothetical protein M3096_04265 [Actinomycetia bacterium]|nr:hypothetical protein [Actinomycetes bacterium]